MGVLLGDCGLYSDCYYLSDGAIAGIAVGALLILVVIPILCCCCCCGWCCFRSRNKNSQEVTIHQPPPPPVSEPQVFAVPHQAGYNQSTDIKHTEWKYPVMMTPEQSHVSRQGQVNHGYVAQEFPNQYHPVPDYNNAYYSQQNVNQYNQNGYGFGYRQQDYRVPRNHLGQTHYDIYQQPKRPLSNFPRANLPRAKF